MPTEEQKKKLAEMRARADALAEKREPKLTPAAAPAAAASEPLVGGDPSSWGDEILAGAVDPGEITAAKQRSDDGLAVASGNVSFLQTSFKTMIDDVGTAQGPLGFGDGDHRIALESIVDLARDLGAAGRNSETPDPIPAGEVTAAKARVAEGLAVASGTTASLQIAFDNWIDDIVAQQANLDYGPGDIRIALEEAVNLARTLGVAGK